MRDGAIDPILNVQPIITGGGATIYSFAETADGKIMVSGGFSAISGGTSSSVARLNADGSFDSTFVGRSTGLVKASFPLPDGRVYITGQFLQYQGISRRFIARLNSDGSLDQTFNPNFGNDTVQIVAVQPDGRIIVNGTFTSIGGVARQSVARLNSDGSVDMTFNAGTGTDINGIEKGLVRADGRIIFIGRFRWYNGTFRYGIVQVNADGSLDTSFVPNIPGQDQGSTPEFWGVDVMNDGRVLLAGNNFGAYVYRLNPDGSIDESYARTIPWISGSLRCMALQTDGKVVIGSSLGSLVRLNFDGTKDTSFVVSIDQGPSLGIRGIILADNKLLVGGDFSTINGSRRGGLGRINLDGTLDLSYAGFFGSVTTINAFLNLPDNSILVAGSFDFLSGSPNKYVAKISSSGVVDGSYHLDLGVDNVIRTISGQSDGKILLGGDSGSDFSRIPSKGIWRLNPDGTLDTTLDARIATLETVWTIAQQTDGKVLVGGNFTKINNINRRALARLNSDGSLDTSFLPDVGGLVVRKVIVQPDGKILVSGEFTTFNGAPIRNFVRLNPDGSIDSTFNIGTGASSAVNAVLVQGDGRIYLGGSFSSFNGVSKGRLVRLLPDGSFDPQFKTVRVNGNVTAISEAPDGKVVIGGIINSTVVGAAVRQGVLRLLSDGSVDYSFDVKGVIRNGSGGEVFQVGVQPDGQVVVAGQFEQINGSARSGFARLRKSARLTPASHDYDGDGRSDLAVFSPADGAWFWIASSSGQGWTIGLGASSDITLPTDFDGDFITDNVVFSPFTAGWTIYTTSDGQVSNTQFGSPGDIPLPADYDGDGKADLCVWRPTDGNWFILNSSTGSLQMIQFGQSGDEPVPADYDGDGKTDLALVSATGGRLGWKVLRSDGGPFRTTYFGLSGDRAIPGDYDGDWKAQLVVRRAGASMADAATVLQRRPRYKEPVTFMFGTGADYFVPGNFDGDNNADFAAVASNGAGLQWLIRSGSTGAISGPTAFGISGDRPASASFRDQGFFARRPKVAPRESSPVETLTGGRPIVNRAVRVRTSGRILRQELPLK